MENKGSESGAIKIDPAIVRIKKQHHGRARLSSTCLAPSSHSTKPGFEGKQGQNSPKPVSPAKSMLYKCRATRKKKSRRWYRTAVTALVQRGSFGDHVMARFVKQGMVVELSVRRSRSATWQPESVEKQIFQQLNEAGLRIEPVGGWGFLNFLNDSPEFSYVAGEPHKTVPVRMTKSSLKHEVNTCV